MRIRKAWVNALYRAATSTKRTRTLLTPVGLVVFAVFVASFVVAALFVDEALGLPGVFPKGAIRLSIGIPVLVVGCVVTAWSAAHFIRVKGTPVPFNPPPRLVTSGPYRYVRNPMLTGVFVILFGAGLLLGSFALVFVFTPLFVLLNIWELRQIEEPELETRLGDEYSTYRDKTPMFVPRRRAEPQR